MLRPTGETRHYGQITFKIAYSPLIRKCQLALFCVYLPQLNNQRCCPASTQQATETGKLTRTRASPNCRQARAPLRPKTSPQHWVHLAWDTPSVSLAVLFPDVHSVVLIFHASRLTLVFLLHSLVLLQMPSLGSAQPHPWSYPACHHTVRPAFPH